MKPKIRILTAPRMLLMMMILAAAIGCVILFERTSITIVNSNPYPCAVAVKYQSAPNTWKTIGWMLLGPGERTTITAIFYRVEPEYFVTAESRDQTLLSWLTAGDGVVYFRGTEISGQVPKNRDINLAEAEDQNVELEEVKFVRVNSEEALHILADPLFQDAVLRNEGAEVANEEEGLELIREKAEHLHESLHRQKTFEETFKSESDYPFNFEFTMTDDPEQGFMYLGVRLSEVRSHTLHGDEIELRNGDVLIGIGSGEKPVTPIYAPADAYIALHEAATDTENGGIGKPLQFILTRNGELLQVESYYLFNPAFNWNDVGAGRAFIESGVNSLTLGFWPRIVSVFSADPDAGWKTSQRLGRLKQFHPTASTLGDIAGLLPPVPTKILSLGRTALGGRMISSPVVRGVSVEVLRLAVYTYNTSNPAPQSRQVIAGDLSKLFSLTRSPNVVEGFYDEEETEPAFKQRSQTFGLTH